MPTSRVKIVLLTLLAAALVAVSTWVLSRAGEFGLFFGVVGVVGLAFFGACGIYALIRLARPRPAVVINRQGILDNASAVSVGFLEWSEIEELQEYRYGNQVFLGIFPRDLDALLARQPAWKRVFIRANLRLGTAPVNIPQGILPMQVSQLLREIDARFRRQADA